MAAFPNRPLEIGDLFFADMKYEQDPNQSKVRPIVLIDHDEGGFWIVVEGTTKGPNDPPTYHDRYKIPFLTWRGYLEEATWFKAVLIYLTEEEIKEVRVEGSYIDKLEENEFNRLITEIEDKKA